MKKVVKKVVKAKVVVKKVVMPKFTDEQKIRIASVIRRTWQTIGGDAIDASGKGFLTKNEMIEVTTDADYISVYGGDDEANKWIDELFKASYDGAHKFLRKLFKYERYS